MEKIYKRLGLWLMLLFALPSFMASAQFTTLAIQDFDTIGTPTLGYTSNGTMTYAKGLTTASATIPNTPYGMNNSRSWYSAGGDLITTFNNVTTLGYDTVYVSFKLAALFDVDAGDYVLVSISVDGGTNWYDRVRVNGNGSNCSWAYSATGVVDHLFAPVNTTTTYTPPAAGVSAAGPSTIIIRVPNATGQVRVKIRQRESTSSEAYYLDDLAIKVRGTTLNNAAVTGLVSPVNFCAGNHDLKVKIANKGMNILNSVTINHSLNGVLQTPLYLYSPLDTVGGTGPKDTTLLLSNIFLGTGTTTNLKVWTSDPNNTTDGFPQDDTMDFVLKPSLNGTYQIGGSSPNYLTLTAAVTDLNTYGVCGPVVFNVAAGTYTGALNLNYIQGASSVNTVDFIGANANSTIITSSTSNGSTVVLTESKYLTFRNFTINNTVTGNGTGFAFAGKTNKCAMKNCTINFPNAYGYTTYGINVTGTLSGYGSTDSQSDSVTIDSNIVNGTYYGIYCYGNSNAGSPLFNRDFKVRSNTINNANYFGIANEYIFNAVDVSNNIINMDSLGDTYSYGIYLYECENSNTSTFHNISYNTIKNAGAYGIYCYYTLSTASNPAHIFNNMLSGGFRNSAAYPIYIYENTSSPSLIYHNSVNLDFASSSVGYAALYYYGSNNTMIKNNILSYTAMGGAGMPLYMDNTIASGNINNNIYYNSVGSAVLYKNGTTYNKTNFKTLAAGGDLSYHTDPLFAGAKNLHVSNGCLRGAPLTALIPVDIDGQTRPTTPMIGADEITLQADNISVDAILSPVIPITAGLQDVVVSVRNKGNNTVYSFNVSYELNNGTPITQFWTGTLGTCDTTTIVFTGFNQANFISANKLTVFTSAPNSLSDSYPIDDTLTKEYFTPLNGTYVIGSGTADFANFTQAANALKGGGVNGPVIFEVKTGTYNESIYFFSAITGISATNTVTFRSMANHRDSVILTFNSASSATVTLAEVQFFTFKNMTIEASNSNFGRVIELAGSASDINVEGCKIKGAAAGGYENIYGYNVTGKRFSFKNNLITDGYYGIYLNGGGSTTAIDSIFVEGNTFQGMSGFAAYFYYTRNLKMRDNTITGNMSYGLRAYYSYDALEIIRNNINITGTYGMYIYYSNGTATAGALVANNSIKVTGTYGIRNYYGSYQKYYNNSISVTGNYPIYVSYNNASYNNNEWKNNIFHTTGTSATSYAAYIVGNIGTNNIFDYNIYHTSGSNVIFNTVAYATFAAYRVAYPAHDANSINVAPAFTSTTNLAPALANVNSWYMNGRGVQTINNTDINNNPRSTTLVGGAPDIGAYEFTPTALPLLATASPANPAAGTTQVFTLSNDTVASIIWAAASIVPTSLNVRFYSGEYAPQTNASHYRTNCYWDMQATGSGNYNYTVNLRYKESMKGSIVTEADMRLAKMDGSNPWTLYTGTLSSIDATRNILTAPNLTGFSIFTGTDNTNPLPVKLSSFEASKAGIDVKVNWTTASERNVSHFLVEASADGRTFIAVGKMMAKGNSSTTNFYTFIHNDAQHAMKGAGIIYYRLTSVDLDGSKETSRSVRVSFDERSIAATTAYPNPFIDGLVLNITAIAASTATIEVTGLGGEVIIASLIKQLEAGVNELQLNELNNLKAGIYFIKITTNGESKVIKIVKQ